MTFKEWQAAIELTGGLVIAAWLVLDVMTNGGGDTVNASRMAGIAINPATSAESLSAALDFCDYILVMTVNPGFGGQKFIEPVVAKIRHISRLIRERGLPVDPTRVDRPVAGRGQQPRRRAGRHAVAGPALQRRGDGVGGDLLGQVQVAEAAHERGEQAAPLLTEDRLDRVGRRTHRRSADQENSMIGRTSTDPYFAPGHFAAQSMAASRSGTSIR